MVTLHSSTQYQLSWHKCGGGGSEVSVTIKIKGDLCGDGAVLDLEGGGGNGNLYVMKWYRTRLTHCHDVDFLVLTSYSSYLRSTQ